MQRKPVVDSYLRSTLALALFAYMPLASTALRFLSCAKYTNGGFNSISSWLRHSPDQLVLPFRCLQRPHAFADAPWC